MQYEELGPISRPEAAAWLATDDPERIGRALLRLALHDADRVYVEGKCLSFASHPSIWVRRNVATALGHLARLHRHLDVVRVRPVLMELRSDADVAPWAETALDDLRISLTSRNSSWVAPASPTLKPRFRHAA